MINYIKYLWTCYTQVMSYKEWLKQEKEKLEWDEWIAAARKLKERESRISHREFVQRQALYKNQTSLKQINEELPIFDQPLKK